MYDCYCAEVGQGVPWEKLARVVKVRWERIASRYHEKVGRHG